MFQKCSITINISTPNVCNCTYGLTSSPAGGPRCQWRPPGVQQHPGGRRHPQDQEVRRGLHTRPGQHALGAKVTQQPDKNTIFCPLKHHLCTPVWHLERFFDKVLPRLKDKETWKNVTTLLQQAGNPWFEVRDIKDRQFMQHLS